MNDVTAIAQQHHAFGKTLQTAAARDATALWRRVDPDRIVPSWADLLPQAVALVTAAQLTAAEDGAAYTTAALAAQGIPTSGPQIDPAGFAGTTYPLNPAINGFNLTDTFMAPAYATLALIKTGYDPSRALAGGLNQVLLRTQLQVADAGRQAGGVMRSSRDVSVGMVRMVSPGCCSRCAILAGKWYRRNAGFDRHPGCRCTGIPALENEADNYLTDPYEYFNSLDADEQRRIFTNAGAKAINDGADIFQVVNARSGMYTSSGGSLVTREGVTRRGYFGSLENSRGLTRDRRKGERYGVTTRQRMMPEEIYKRARGNREREISLLTEYGYITPVGQVPTGAIRGAGAGYMGGRKPRY
jgi:hypothetical protein